MPKHNRCYYGYCDSDNRVDSSIVFYRFPKDPERCRMWVRSCNNPELTQLWQSNPERVTKLGICQHHFLPQFLGSSNRLVGHAIPTPMMEVDHDEFMTTCAGLKAYPSASSSNKVVTESVTSAEADLDNLFNRIENIKNSADQAIVITHPLNMHSYKATPPGPGPQVIVINTCPGPQSTIQSNLAVTLVQPTIDETTNVKGKRKGNCSNNEYKMVIPVALPAGSNFMPADDSKAQIEALKKKIRFYQRKLAVTNHRYQRLRRQLNIKSKNEPRTE